MKIILDNRHSVTLEFCGYENPRPVTRFCGDYLGNHATRKEAFAALTVFEKERRARL